MTSLPQPTQPHSENRPDFELQRWTGIYAGENYYYGYDPGPVARRAVRYHRSFLRRGGSALDAGCGEGQDLAFLAAQGYDSVGVDFVGAGLEKARKLLDQRAVQAQVIEVSLREYEPQTTFDLMLAVNSMQFLGADALPCLHRLMAAVSPGGVIGISLFAREHEEQAVKNSVYFATLPEILQIFANWQPLEAAKLWQWNQQTGQAQPFITLIARNVAPHKPVQLLLES